MDRYGPDGSYWSGEYREQYPDAAPMPIDSWQIWNEPNLSKYFAPQPSAPEYARLVQISADAITAGIPRPGSCSRACPGAAT